VANNTLQKNIEVEEQSLIDELLLRGNLDDVIPQLARDMPAIARIESAVRRRHTAHELILDDARASGRRSTVTC
jgi:hypothetical protein